MAYRVGSVSNKVPFDQVMDFSVLQKLAKEPKYASQTSDYAVNFAPRAASSIQAESPEILTKTVVIHFYPNSFDIDHKITKQDSKGKTVEEPYDPNVPFVMEEVGRLAGQYGAARIVIEGHTDGSMRGSVAESAVVELSSNRALAVKQAIVSTYHERATSAA